MSCVLSVPSIGPVEELGNAAKKAKWWQPLLYFEPIGDGPNWKANWAIIGPQAIVWEPLLWSLNG